MKNGVELLIGFKKMNTFNISSIVDVDIIPVVNVQDITKAYNNYFAPEELAYTNLRELVSKLVEKMAFVVNIHEDRVVPGQSS